MSTEVNDDYFDDYQRRLITAEIAAKDEEPDGANRGDARVFRGRTREVNLPQHEEAEQQLRAQHEALKLEAEQIRQRIERNERLEKAIKHIPVLFDRVDAPSIRAHLAELLEAGVTEIKMGQTQFSVQALDTAIRKVDEYSLAKLHTPGTPKEDETEQFLDSLDVPTDKISVHSKYSFHEAMKKFIQEDSRAAVQ